MSRLALWRARTRSDPPLAAVSGGKYRLATEKVKENRLRASLHPPPQRACALPLHNPGSLLRVKKKISLD